MSKRGKAPITPMAPMTPAQAIAWAKKFTKIVAAFADLHAGLPVELMAASITSLAALALTAGGMPREIVSGLVAQIVSTLPGEVETQWAEIEADSRARTPNP